MLRQPKRSVGSLARGLQVLDALGEYEELKLSDLPDLLGMSRATAFRLLATLQDRGYVDHNKSTHSYGLGPTAFALGSRSKAARLVRAAEPALNRLRTLTDETLNLADYQGGRLIYVRIWDGSSSLRMSGVVGGEVPMHASGLGKGILMKLPDDERKAVAGPEPFPELTERTVTNMSDLEIQLVQFSELGYAVDDQEVVMGALCLAAPIVSSDGKLLGGISISGPAARLPKSLHDRYGRALADAATEVGVAFSAAMGKSEPSGALPPKSRA